MSLVCVFLYLAGHKCDEAGCGSVIVLDGNMKNSRQICEATDAGFVEHDGLPGMVKTGCMNTPDQKSRFCAIDKPRQLISDDCSGVIEMIVSKKTTRSTTFYQASGHFRLFIPS